ncbi:Hypothetical_protein [Hexamita inflata]|uniref:Hypothetical_protein n=1 Tax=Hexamita inflata TaxID=28002 RepID=A0AA86QED7_9EUKA|nr:Hypothetical protein HINF_LOCUS45379 [Hexamita inflata]
MVCDSSFLKCCFCRQFCEMPSFWYQLIIHSPFQERKRRQCVFWATRVESSMKWNESNYYFKNGITLQLRWEEENIQRYTICKSAFFAAYSENHKYYVVWSRPYIPGMRIEPELGKKPRRQLEGKRTRQSQNGYRTRNNYFKQNSLEHLLSPIQVDIEETALDRNASVSRWNDFGHFSWADSRILDQVSGAVNSVFMTAGSHSLLWQNRWEMIQIIVV